MATSENLGRFSGPSSRLSDLDLGNVPRGKGNGGRHWGHFQCPGVWLSQEVTGDSNLGGLISGDALRRDVGIPGLGARLGTKGAPIRDTYVQVLTL